MKKKKKIIFKEPLSHTHSTTCLASPFESFSRDPCPPSTLSLCFFSFLISCPLYPLPSTRGGQGCVEVTVFAAEKKEKKIFF